MISIDINKNALINIHGVNYHCIIVGVRKSETIDLLKTSDFSLKSRPL